MFKRASLPIALFSALLACVCALLGGGEQTTRTATRAEASPTVAAPPGTSSTPGRR